MDLLLVCYFFGFGTLGEKPQVFDWKTLICLFLSVYVIFPELVSLR